MRYAVSGNTVSKHLSPVHYGFLFLVRASQSAMSLFSELMADKYGKNVNRDRSEKDKSDKEDKPEKHSKRGKCSSTASSREKRPAEESKASTSAVAREQNNAGVDQGEKALLEIVMAGFEILNKSIVSLRQQDEPTSEEYQLDDLPDDELADPGEVDADSSEYSRLAKIMRVLN